MKNNPPSLAKYRNDYQTAKSLGSPALVCNAVMIPTGFESLRLLIQNFPRPMVTYNDPADVDYAGGLASHVQGAAKTSFEGSITLIETELGTVSQFAETLMTMGGHLDECKVVFGSSDGTSASGAIVYTIQDVKLNFTDGGGEIDASSRSQILTVQGSIRYMYFGEHSSLGVSGAGAFGAINQALTGNRAGKIAGALDGLLGLVRGGGFSVPKGAKVGIFN